jgi:hypothetical protein
LAKGIDISVPLHAKCEGVKHISLVLIEDHVYAKIEFKDLEKGETIG